MNFINTNMTKHYKFAPVLLFCIFIMLFKPITKASNLFHLDESDMLKILLDINQNFPGLFSKKSTYDVSLTSTLDELNLFSEQNPTIPIDLYSLYKMVTIKGTVNSELISSEAIINPDSLNNF